MNSNIYRRTTDSGIAILTFDRPGSSANILDRETLEELNGHLAVLEGEKELSGVILESAKPKIFIAGVDLKVFSRDIPEEDIASLIELGQLIFNRLERLRVPTVAAIGGACLGGGLELTLACDYRVASNAKATKIGLPEVTLGLLPAWGGCTRLPRLIGLPRALQVILKGQTHSARQAKKIGFVDETVFPERLLDFALEKVLAGRRPSPPRFLSNYRLIARFIAKKARERVLAETHCNYPAPLKSIDVLTNGLHLAIEDSLRNERKSVMNLIETDACRNLVSIFFLQERSKHLSSAAPPESDSEPAGQDVRRTAVIGAGTMGSGIAQWLSSRGLNVLLRDTDRSQLARGLAKAEHLFRDGVTKGLFTRVEAQAGMDRIWPIEDSASLRRLDLIVEAVFEDLELKKGVVGQLEQRTDPETILVTNTSALPISEIAQSLKRPERFIGIHFFNPVHRMKLVEVVGGEETSDETLRVTLSFVKSIGKLPVIVRDKPGFLVNRILIPYLVEALNLFEEGVSVSQMDEAMLEFGMPMGPFRLLDEVGLGVAQRVAQYLGERLSYSLGKSQSLQKMIDRGWTGKRGRIGFYRYPESSRKAVPNPKLFLVRSSERDQETRIEPVVERMVFRMINEAARCLEEEVVREPDDVDFAMIMGTGWAPFRGGPLRYADSVGLSNVVRKLEELEADGFENFRPCPLLTEMAAKGESFYRDRSIQSDFSKERKAS